MAHIDLIACGKLKAGPFQDLYNTYAKRLSSPLNLIEITVKGSNSAHIQQQEEAAILKHIDPTAFIFVLDEKGKSLGSAEMANFLGELQVQGISKVQFIIGGADGLTQAVRKKAGKLISFGQQTWPHQLVRVMLVEQLYRCQSILSGHPYHKE